MADISMCNSHTCPSRGQCYRHEAEPSPYRQTYMDFDANRGDAEKCDRFMQIDKKVLTA